MRGDQSLQNSLTPPQHHRSTTNHGANRLGQAFANPAVGSSPAVLQPQSLHARRSMMTGTLRSDMTWVDAEIVGLKKKY
jgi:hypothetical protein